MLILENHVDLSVGGTTMRTYTFKPNCEGVKLPGIVLFSEIYQVTGPVARLGRELASKGYVVVSSECYHEFEEPGTVLKYNAEDTDKGNEYKIKKTCEQYDADAAALVEYLVGRDDCNGRIGTVGMCLGGHLAARCLFEKHVIAGCSFFGTDIHKGSLGKNGDNTLARLKNKEYTEEKEIIFIWGKQDRHTPPEGRRLIYDTLHEADADFTWLEVNAKHAFIRDELSKGRYDAAIVEPCKALMYELFHRRLALGAPSMKNSVAQQPEPKC